MGTRSWTAPNACPLSGSHASLTEWRLSNWVSAFTGEAQPPLSENFPFGYFGRPDHDPHPALDRQGPTVLGIRCHHTPFPGSRPRQLRAILGPRHLHERCPGQPFLLDLVSHLASLSGDPDWEFPLTLKEGALLGVSDPTLTSPGVWPTKEELKGEAWLGEDPPPAGSS